MTHMQASVLMVLVVLARSIAYLFSKTPLGEVAPLCLLALRFGLAFALLAIMFRKQLLAASRAELARGLGLGGLLAALMFCEMLALKITDTTVVSFIENTAVVLVLLAAAALFGVKLRASSMCCALVALGGVALLTVCGTHASIGAGDGFAKAAAVLYALFIVVTARFSRACDPILLGVAQMAGAFAVCAVATFALETPSLPQSATGWGCLAVLVLVCSVFGFTFQPVAQKYISAVQAGMTCATNPACASVVGVLVLGEQLTPLGWCGAALVLTALIISTLLGNKAREGNSAKAAE